MSRSPDGRSDEFEVNPEEVRFGIFHAKYAKGAKEIIFFETLVTLATVAWGMGLFTPRSCGTRFRAQRTRSPDQVGVKAGRGDWGIKETLRP
jgi:hypothetical protein